MPQGAAEEEQMAVASFFLSCRFSPLHRPLSTRGSLCIPIRRQLGQAPRIADVPISPDAAGNPRRRILQFSISAAGAVGSSSEGNDSVPDPLVFIYQDDDLDATVVEVSFGDRLGSLVDTMRALKDLRLHVTKGTVTTESSVIKTKIFIARSGRKVEDPNMLEKIRLTIISNLLKYHPESSEKLAMGEAFGIKPPEKKLDTDITTHIHVQEVSPKRSLLYVETADHPGLLLEIIQIMADINISVESAEIDTEGLIAKDKFYVSYRGAALNSSLSQVLVNCLRYHFRKPETEEESY